MSKDLAILLNVLMLNVEGKMTLVFCEEMVLDTLASSDLEFLLQLQIRMIIMYTNALFHCLCLMDSNPLSAIAIRRTCLRS